MPHRIDIYQPSVLNELVETSGSERKIGSRIDGDAVRLAGIGCP